MRSPLIAMSAITGRVKKEEICKYLKQLKENGIEQFMVYPRSGCELTYLSQEWFDTVTVFIQYAKQLDMKVWLYDEFNWPSGDAGGRVTARKEFRLRGIKIQGEDKGRISFDSMHNSQLFGVKLFPDVLSHEAVEYFIQCTHEKYAEHFGEYFGNVIVGMFTDEPSMCYACGADDLPYFDGLEEAYKKACGRNFYTDLENEHEDLAKICMALAGNRFRECFVEKIGHWCSDHGLLMTGHLFSDDTPFTATRANGDLLGAMSQFMLPGIDEIETILEEPRLLTLLGAAEYAGNEHGAMAELYALGPCDLSYAKRRCMLYYTACFKIDHYFLAIAPMDFRGNAKITDYFNCFTADQPDFAGMRLFAEEAKKAAEYAGLDYAPEVLVRYPSSLCAKYIKGEAKDGVFADLAGMLSLYQIQWKFIAEGEDCNGIPVIEFAEDFRYCLDGVVTADAKEICDLCRRKSLVSADTERVSGSRERGLVVTDKAGNPVQGIFVRRFQNGEVIVLNLSAPAEEYLVFDQAVWMDEHAVYITNETNTGQENRCKRVAEHKECLNTEFQINYHNPNIIRTMYINGQNNAEVYCERDVGMEVVFSLRKGVRAWADAEEIRCDSANTVLSEGFRKFYDMSGVYQLNRGRNMITAGEDIKFFPSVLISGDFAAKVESGEICRVILSDRKKRFVPGEYFCDFGKVEFTAKVRIPEKAEVLELTGTKLYTCVYVEEKLIGESICRPYIFPIDKELRGKEVTLKIVQFSSIGPIFGDVEYYDKHSEKVGWKGTPSTGKTLFGFERIQWGG